MKDDKQKHGEQQFKRIEGHDCASYEEASDVRQVRAVDLNLQPSPAGGYEEGGSHRIRIRMRDRGRRFEVVTYARVK